MLGAGRWSLPRRCAPTRRRRGPAGRLDLAAGEAQEALQLGSIGRCEADLEVRPGRSGRRRHPRLDRADRLVRPHAHGDTVLAAEEFGADVIAEWVVTRDGHDREHARGHAQHRYRRVDVPVLLEDGEAAHRAIRVHLHDLVTRQPAQDIEVVTREVTEQSARDRDVGLVWWRRVMAGQAHAVQDAQLAAVEQALGLLVGRIEAALEAQLERAASSLDVPARARSRRQGRPPAASRRRPGCRARDRHG